MYVQISLGPDSLVFKRYGAGRERANGIANGVVIILVEHRRRAKDALSRCDAQCLVCMDSHLSSAQSRFTAPKLPSTDTEPISRIDPLSA
jgi:hypothetical protein